jgi:hypothetical protein
MMQTSSSTTPIEVTLKHELDGEALRFANE